MNQSQNMSNAPYSISHKNVLIVKDRLRVAKQLVSILQDYTNNKTFKNSKILDVGCSGGTLTNYISSYSNKTIGIDIDKHAIQKASLKYDRKNLLFKYVSGTSIPYKAKFFDIVICNQVYSYTNNPDKMMSEIMRVLKPGGFCLFTGDNLLRPIEPLYNLPFLRWLPRRYVGFLLKKMGYKNYYIGKYKTYWGLIKMCKSFEITDYTIKVIKNPKKYKFVKLLKYKKIIDYIPNFILNMLEPLFPTYIFILKKGN